MYAYDYEEDVLLSLRLLKFLHGQDPKALKRLAGSFEKFSADDIFELTDLAIWEIFDNVAFDSDPEFETSVVTFSHPAIDRLYELGRRLEVARGRFAVGLLQKIHDIMEFFVCGASNSVYHLDVRSFGGGVEIEMRLSPDCYETIRFANSLVDALLYIGRENGRLEQLVKETEFESEQEIGKEAA